MKPIPFKSWLAYARSEDGTRRLLGAFAAREGHAQEMVRFLWPQEYCAGLVELVRDRADEEAAHV